MIRSRPAERDGDREIDGVSRRRSRREDVRLGAAGGLVATVVMTAFRLTISHSLPPTDEFWRRYVHRDDSGSATIPALTLHLLYGASAGVAYAVLGSQFARESRHARSPEASAELRGVVTAVIYGLFLSVFGQRVLLTGLLDEELDPDEALIFHLGHVIYGITLGAWLGSRRTAK